MEKYWWYNAKWKKYIKMNIQGFPTERKHRTGENDVCGRMVEHGEFFSPSILQAFCNLAPTV